MEPSHRGMADVALVQWILATGGQVYYSKLKVVVESALHDFESLADLASITTLFCAFPRGVDYQKEVSFLVQCLNTLHTRSKFVFGSECEAEIRLRDIIHSLLFMPEGNQYLVTGNVSPELAKSKKTTPSKSVGTFREVPHKKGSYRPRYYKFGAFQSPPTETKSLPDPDVL